MLFKRKKASFGIESIKPVEESNIKNISNMVSKRLITVFPEAKIDYYSINKKLINTPMYYAKIPKELAKANYDYKSSTLYLAEDIDFYNDFEYVLHECIHKLQENKDKKANITRFGLCEINDFSVKALALNEGAIQYIVERALNRAFCEIKVYNIILQKSTKYYPLLTNLILQLVYLLGENTLIDSTLNSNENFKIEIIDNIGEMEYNALEKNMNKILQLKSESNNIEVQKEIEKLYFDSQSKIYKGYFNKILKCTENIFEVECIKEKFLEYGKIIGKTADNFDFIKYSEIFEKNVNFRINELKNKNLLAVVNNNKITNFFRKIRKAFSNSAISTKN